MEAHHDGRLFIDDKRFWPIFERAQPLDVPIYLHPSRPHPAVIDAYYKDYAKEFPSITNARWGFGVETGTLTDAGEAGSLMFVVSPGLGGRPSPTASPSRRCAGLGRAAGNRSDAAASLAGAPAKQRPSRTHDDLSPS